jgi:1-acyl-sn-glycerol-3-phosphate acyltransferase
VAVNLATGLGCMYPPIFRDPAKAALNKDALQRLIGYLAEPGSVVGVHPEGTRNKTDDPYALLPAQPGIGEIALKARPLIVPLFVNGMGNSAAREIADGQVTAARREKPIVIVYGAPVDLSEFDGQLPRAALYKKVSDKILLAIKELIPREQELRRIIQDGSMSDSEPGWLDSIRAARAQA